MRTHPEQRPPIRPHQRSPSAPIHTDDLQQIGLRHPRVRQIRDVINNAGPNHRRLLVAEGLWAHNVVLDLGAPIDTFLWCPEASYSDEALVRSAEVVTRARSAYRISPTVMARICERERPDGMVSLVALPAWDHAEMSFGPDALVLVADAIEIPGNLGTLLRTLDACGADCLVLTNRRTRLTHPKVFRGSRGMNLRVPTVEFESPDLAADWLAANGFTVHLATVGESASGYGDVAFGGRTALVVGNERYGISRPWFSYGFSEVTVPMHGRADSLNVSVSASILLYEIRRHQTSRGDRAYRTKR
ncbi:MAG TPA: TrmH family RNA methyltransferase [Micromonosporaceae bacterium]|nr:TrmH family RNA methyltransferase [Micromonosporaceae bacterium]